MEGWQATLSRPRPLSPPEAVVHPLGRERVIAIIGGSGFIATGIGLGVGLGCDLVARVTGGRFSIRATRVRRDRAKTQFANARSLATSCMPRHELHDAPVAMIRHQFAPNAASAATWAFARSELGRDL